MTRTCKGIPVRGTAETVHHHDVPSAAELLMAAVPRNQFWSAATSWDDGTLDTLLRDPDGHTRREVFGAEGIGDQRRGTASDQQGWSGAELSAKPAGQRRAQRNCRPHAQAILSRFTTALLAYMNQDA